ncbi:MAG: hypothetical protein A3D44_02035 [Candidatus Staskawiczbacteria bacterium RIFCSPHIGHO2_02_FULL_42_22]|uniref:Uncharacterized protein n=1 Tax=Candidatus Staskawiczbacteria bacterium RIFCSPHIGHO2_02_FULL_42_22 TaxID=1802207 RepID=A0A1G2I1R3_9BACT|nr:MAG: hypothetical protein A3D44_02035 [Candidatus Staskawiczbacteria bacterium RIFCSPHIGHO2_02_FULL_42_22]
MAKEILGLGIRGIIASSMCDDQGKYEEIPGAFKMLARLQRERFSEGIFLVSYAWGETHPKILHWLFDHIFHKVTGIPAGNVYLFRHKVQEVAICRELEITHFISDSTELLVALNDAGIENLYLFHGPDQEQSCSGSILRHVTQVTSWQEIAKNLLG